MIIYLSASGNSGVWKLNYPGWSQHPLPFCAGRPALPVYPGDPLYVYCPPSPAEAGSGNQCVSCSLWESRLRLLSVDPFVLALIPVPSSSGKDREADYTILKSFRRQEGQEGGETAGEH